MALITKYYSKINYDGLINISLIQINEEYLDQIKKAFPQIKLDGIENILIISNQKTEIGNYLNRSVETLTNIRSKMIA